MNKKAKKVTINLINKNDNKCFQYTTKLALNHEEIGVHSEWITTTNPFIDKYNWEEINYPSENHDSKKLEKNNLTIVLNGKDISCLRFKRYIKVWNTSYSFKDFK